MDISNWSVRPVPLDVALSVAPGRDVSERMTNVAPFAGYAAASEGNQAVSRRALRIAKSVIDRAPRPALASFVTNRRGGQPRPADA